MFEWSEEQLAIRDAVRRFVEEEVKPQVEELEHGETPPYAVIRKLYQTFGLDVMARESAKKAIERKANGASGAPAARGEGGGSAAMTLIPIVMRSTPQRSNCAGVPLRMIVPPARPVLTPSAVTMPGQ